ncbi:MAG: hypothetical protein ACOCUT_04020 [bacterium]
MKYIKRTSYLIGSISFIYFSTFFTLSAQENPKKQLRQQRKTIIQREKKQKLKERNLNKMKISKEEYQKLLVPQLSIKQYGMKFSTTIDHCALKFNEPNTYEQYELQPFDDNTKEMIKKGKAETCEIPLTMWGWSIGPKWNDALKIIKYIDTENHSLEHLYKTDWEVCRQDINDIRKHTELYSCLNASISKLEEYYSKNKITRPYRPLRSNCCHFVEQILLSCNLKPCFKLPPNGSILNHTSGAVDDYRKKK